MTIQEKGNTNEDIPTVSATVVSDNSVPQPYIPAATTTTTTTAAAPAPATVNTVTATALPPKKTTTTTTTTTVIAPTNLGRSSQGIQCPYCKNQTVTRTVEMTDAVTILAVIVLLLVFWPLFWLPLCMSDCKTTEHYCSSCNQKVGETKACQ